MQHVELRPDRKLLKSNFNGYKLSLDPIPILRMELPEANRPHRVRPNDQQYSYHHARLFGMQNHLVRDPWATGQCYYITVSGVVQRLQYDETVGRLKPISAVFELPPAVHHQGPEVDQSNMEDRKTAGTYNRSIAFASEQYCLLSDGQGTVRVLDTGDRTNGRHWVACGVFRPAEVDAGSKLSAGGCTLLDARLVVEDGKKQLHCIAMQVEHQLEGQSETLLYWFTLEQQQPQQAQQRHPEWTFHTSRMLGGGGFPRYCSLDHNASAVLVASAAPFRFMYDSERPVEQYPPPQAKVSTPEKPQAYETYPFEWHQTISQLFVTFVKREGVTYLIQDDTGPVGLRVLADGITVIDSSEFFGNIVPDSTTWWMDRTTLEIVVQKQVSGIIWPFIFPDGPDEVDVAGSVDEATVAADLPPATSLDAPLEDCDFGAAGETEEYFTLERLSRTTNQVTHHTSLGSGPPLFSVTLRAGAPAAIVLRHDVDACLWQLQPPIGPDDYRLHHEGTLHAFGYVQASKRQQKFLACSPDYGYAAICESERRLFIYKASYGGGGAGLKHRNGPQVSLGQQRLVCLDDDGEILGVSCEKEVMLLLTESALLTLQLGIEE